MPTNFAVIDAGSNAIRLQIASVDQPGTYRIIEQDRRPARLGHKVFETGALDAASRSDALEALKRFKNISDRHGVSSIRAIATSAMREARDGHAFIEDVAQLGITLEVLSEEEEARLISLGILSGLKFDPPLGLFMDIGGGSVELAVGNHSNMFALFSVPLGAVRLTERFLKHDPPTEKELESLARFVKQKMGPAARRLSKEKFTMAFGSGGTMTSLAEMDARLTGETHQESLYVLRRGRLKSLFDLLRSQPLHERVASIVGDPRRADILVAGSAVLLSMMTELELDYVFVSGRGLRDGLMVDVLRKSYPAFIGNWTEEANPSQSVEEVGEKYNYDKTHSQQVSRLSLSLFEQMRDLHGLPDRYSSILHAAAMLHDIGLFIAYSKHHKHSYYLIKSSGPSSFDAIELDIIANIARYHRKSHPSPRHLPFGQLSSTQQDVVRKLSAILRVADALDYGRQSKIREIQCKKKPSGILAIRLGGNGDMTDEIRAATEKAGLLGEVYGLEVRFE
ncbi:MAG TPA: Ppx/GppA phosphatase family protein [Terriglobia bacterium]|nr:Ppx/GppA phosphatase family protein [Terriglobia bacterium]